MLKVILIKKLLDFADFQPTERKFRVEIDSCIILSPFIGIKIGPSK